MLPKLQQSSLAQNLRRDNPASSLQSISLFTQMRISLRTLSASLQTNPTSLGRISTHPAIRTPPLETSLKNTCLKRR